LSHTSLLIYLDLVPPFPSGSSVDELSPSGIIAGRLSLADDVHLVSEGTDDPFGLPVIGLNVCAVPRMHNSFGDRSFGAAGPRICNSLPCGLRTLDISYKHFKTLLKTYMFDQATALCDILYKRLRNTQGLF